MAKEKPSFFERLTGAVRMNEAEQEDTVIEHARSLSARSSGSGKNAPSRRNEESMSAWDDAETEKEAELTVDVYQSSDMIVIKSMIAGVRPEDLDVSITRDTVTIRGKREEERTSEGDDYFTRELYWGSFSRIITLPEEIDVDGAEAVEKHGLLILKLPRLDKKRQSKLKVRTG